VDVVFTPDVHAIRSFEFHKARQAIHAGETEAEARLPEVRHAAARRPRRRYWSRGSNS
jgi:predicted acylesterase/phospholipase RssA